MRGNLAGCMRPRQRLDAGRQRGGGLGLEAGSLTAQPEEEEQRCTAL